MRTRILMTDIDKDREVIAAANGKGPGTEERASYNVRARTRYPELVEEVERLRGELDRATECAVQIQSERGNALARSLQLCKEHEKKDAAIRRAIMLLEHPPGQGYRRVKKALANLRDALGDNNG
jgi:hypothetical protein